MSGKLPERELRSVAEFVLERLYPGAEDAQTRQAEADKLVDTLHQTEDKQLGWSEFEAWCKRTSDQKNAAPQVPSGSEVPKKDHSTWHYINAQIPVPGKQNLEAGGAEERSRTNIAQIISSWNTAAGSMQLIYKAAEELFRKYDTDNTLVLSADQLTTMVKDVWNQLNTPIPKAKEAEVHEQASDCVKQFDKIGAGGVGFAAFVRMITKKPWNSMLPQTVRRELSAFVKSGIPSHRMHPRRETGAKPTASGSPQEVVLRIISAIEKLFTEIAGSEAIIDERKLETYLANFFGDAIQDLDVFVTSVMLMSDRGVLGGLCKSDFSRLVIKEPFCALLPPTVVEDVYYLIDQTAKGGRPVINPEDVPAFQPEETGAARLEVNPPSDQLSESAAEHMEQAKRELLRAAQKGGLKAVFDTFDADQNGFIDGREFIQLARDIAKKMVQDPRARLSESEARAAVYAIIKRIDANQDGQLSFKEMENFVNGYKPKPLVERPIHFDQQPRRGSSARQEKLRNVFNAFDINKDGTIGADELLKLGQARRRLGHKQGEWTHEMNNRMMTRMDSDGDGRIQMNEFVTFFDDLLPRDNFEFSSNIDQFLAVARSVQGATDMPISSTEATPAARTFKPEVTYDSSQPMSLAQKNRRIDSLYMKRNRTPEESRELRELESSLSSRVSQLKSMKSSPKPEKFSRMPPREFPPTPPRVPRKKPDSDYGERHRELKKVFKAFDIDGDGAIGADELLVLGQQRRKLGQKSGEWTKEMNARLMTKLDRSGDGRVEMQEFVEFFDEQLPSLNSKFYQHCDAFMKVAQSLRDGAVPSEVVAAEPKQSRIAAVQQAVNSIDERRAAERRLMQDPTLPKSQPEPKPEAPFTFGLFDKDEKTAASQSKSPSAPRTNEPDEEDDLRQWEADRRKQADRNAKAKAEAEAQELQELETELGGNKNHGVQDKDWSAARRAGEILHDIGKGEQARGADRAGAVLGSSGERTAASSGKLSAAARAEALLYGTGNATEANKLQASIDKQFNQWDTNSDGVIDKAEFTRMKFAEAEAAVEAARVRNEAKSGSRSTSPKTDSLL